MRNVTPLLLALLLVLSAPAEARKASNQGWESLRTFCHAAQVFGLSTKSCRGFR